MARPLLVVISGPSCTGKTTLGKRLATDLGMPFVFKDGIKELLFDTLGWSDRAWSRKLGFASIALLDHSIETLLAAGCSCVVESTFRPEYDDERLRALCARYTALPFQIQCVAEGEVLWRRWQVRTESAERHPGHVERASYDEFRPGLLRGRLDPLSLDGPLVEVDTTDFAALDYDALITAVRAYWMPGQDTAI
jgi:predicted kinase